MRSDAVRKNTRNGLVMNALSAPWRHDVSRGLATICLGASLIALAPSFGRAATITTTASAFRTFVGNAPAKLVYITGYVDKQAYTASVQLLDSEKSPFAPVKLFSGTVEDQSLQISPDGTRICYSVKGQTHVRSLSSGEDRAVCSGSFPHWWFHPTTGVQYLLVKRSDGIYSQELASDGMAAKGSAVKLFGDTRGNGGRTADGKYLVSEADEMMWEFRDAEAVSSAQAAASIKWSGRGNDSAYCNASASPALLSTSGYHGCVLHLGRYHTEFYIRKFTTVGVTVKSGVNIQYGSRLKEYRASSLGGKVYEFMHPEWSTHERYAVTTGADCEDACRSNAHGFIVNFDKGTSLKFLDGTTGGCAFPHMWVRSAQAGKPVAKLTASTVKGFAPLSITFDASASTGDIQSYDWDFGDGVKGTGISANHIYATAGSYTATVTVKGPAGSATAQSTITVQNGTAVAASVEISPRQSINVYPGEIVVFSATVIDQLGSALKDKTVTWVRTGTGGGDYQPGHLHCGCSSGANGHGHCAVRWARGAYVGSYRGLPAGVYNSP